MGNNHNVLNIQIHFYVASSDIISLVNTMAVRLYSGPISFYFIRFLRPQVMPVSSFLLLLKELSDKSKLSPFAFMNTEKGLLERRESFKIARTERGKAEKSGSLLGITPNDCAT